MIAPSITRPATLEDFECLPVAPPYYEFEEGKILLMASPVPNHQDIVAEVTVASRRFVQKQGLGRVFMEVDVYLPDGRVYVPDISYLTTEHLDYVSPVNQKIYGAPDLCVEVVSQDNARDRVKKFKVYLSNGVLWYWLIDPTTLIIEEYRLTGDGYLRTASIAAGETFAPGVFPGLEINLAELLGVTPPAVEEDEPRNGGQAAGQAPISPPPVADSGDTKAGPSPTV